MANIEVDGPNKTIKVDSGDLTFDIPGDIVLDADGANVTFKDGGTSVLDLSNSSTDAVLTVSTQDKDLIIKGDDGGSAVTAATFDMSDAGTLVLNHDLRIGDAGQIGSASDADAIAIASNGVVTFSQAPVFPDGSIAVADLDIDGATDIGAAIVDADLFIVDDGAGGTNRKTTAARLKTYAGFGVGDITGATALAARPDSADELVISDGGTLKRIDFSYMEDGWVPLETYTVSGTSTSEYDFETAGDFDGTYHRLMLSINDLSLTAGGENLQLQVKMGGSYKTDSQYVFHVISGGSDSSDVNGYVHSGTGSSELKINHSMEEDAAGTQQGFIFCDNPAATGDRPCFHWESAGHDNSLNNNHFIGTGVYQGATTALQGIKIKCSSGNFDSGTITLYGLKK